MYISKDQATSFDIPGGTSGRIYPDSPNGDQTIAQVQLDGVYPERGFSLNDHCTETIYMLDGQFDLTYGTKTYTLNPGDLFMILPGTKYRITGRGQALDLITPSWDKSQNHIIETD